MKKTFVLALLLMLPFAYAQEPFLEAKKASLELKAEQFISKMEAAIEFAQLKNLSAEELSDIKDDFEDKKEEALKSETKEDFKEDVESMKDSSKEFRDKAKELFKDFIDDLKDKIKEKQEDEKDELKGKVKNSAEAKKKAIIFALNTKIEKIMDTIKRLKEEGKAVEALEDVLKKFEEEKNKIEGTELNADEEKEEDVNKTSVKEAMTSIKKFFVEAIKEIDES
jgi:hypothetical protein